MKRRTASWRIDAKWVFGILFTLLLMPALAALALFQIGSPKSAKQVAASFIEAQFGQVLDERLGEVLVLARATGDKELVIPELNLHLGITGDQAVSMDRAELKRVIIAKLAEEIYAQERLPKQLSAISGGSTSLAMLASAIKLFGPQMQARLIVLMLVVFGIALAFFIPYLIFSFRFGKVFNIGVSLVIASLPGLAVSGIGRLAVRGLARGGGELARGLSAGFELVSGIAFRTFFLCALIGVALCFVGILAGSIFRAVCRKREREEAERAAAA